MAHPIIPRPHHFTASTRRRACTVAVLAAVGCRGAGGGPEPGRGDPTREAVAVVTRCELPRAR
jgi:hypothetical protein